MTYICLWLGISTKLDDLSGNLDEFDMTRTFFVLRIFVVGEMLFILLDNCSKIFVAGAC